MKRIILLVSLLSVPLIAMQKEQELKKPAAEKIEAGSEKGKVNSSPERLFELSLQAMLKRLAESEEEIIPFVEIAMPQLGDTVCAALIKKYAFKNRDSRLELVAYYAYKSCNGPSNPLIDLAEKRKQKIKQPEKDSAFAVLALDLLTDILNDEAYEDKAVLQPLTVACMLAHKSSSGAYDSKKAYALIRDYLLAVTHEDSILHTLRQLIIHGAEKPFLALQKSFPKGFLERMQLWRLAHLFNRERIVSQLHEQIEADAKRSLCGQFHVCSEKRHLEPQLERAIYKGDISIINMIKVFPEARLSNCLFPQSTCTTVFNIAAMLGYISLMRAYTQVLLFSGDELFIAFVDAANKGQEGAVKLLLPMLPNNLTISSHLQEAFSKHHVSTLKLIVNRFSEHHQLRDLLACAFVTGVDTIAKALLEKIKPQNEIEYVAQLVLDTLNVDYNKKEKAKIVRFALCAAVCRHRANTLAWFLSKNVPLHGFLVNEDENTNPLHAVLRLGRVKETLEKVQLLVQHGAYDEPDRKGKMASDLMMQRVQEAIDFYEQSGETKEMQEDLNAAQEIVRLLKESVSKQRDPLPQSDYTEGLVQYFDNMQT